MITKYRIFLSLIAGTALVAGSAQASVFSANFGSDFDNDGGLNLVSDNDGWTTETDSLLHTGGGDSTWYNFMASTEVSGFNVGSNFQIESTFSWAEDGDGASFRRFGVAFLGDPSGTNLDPAESNSYFSAAFLPFQGDHGQLRLYNAIPDGTITQQSRTSGSVADNTEYTLSLTGTYNQDGDLTIVFSVVDAAGGGNDTLTTTIDAADVHSGQHFGLVGRIRANDTVDYGSFTVVPEPSTGLLLGLVGGLMLLRRRRA